MCLTLRRKKEVKMIDRGQGEDEEHLGDIEKTRNKKKTGGTDYGTRVKRR